MHKLAFTKRFVCRRPAESCTSLRSRSVLSARNPWKIAQACVHEAFCLPGIRGKLHKLVFTKRFVCLGSVESCTSLRSRSVLSVADPWKVAQACTHSAAGLPGTCGKLYKLAPELPLVCRPAVKSYTNLPLQYSLYDRDGVLHSKVKNPAYLPGIDQVDQCRFFQWSSSILFSSAPKRTIFMQI